MVATTANFKNYDSKADAWAGYTEFLQHDRYKNVQGDVGDFYKNLKADSWATDNLYVSKLKSVEASTAIRGVVDGDGSSSVAKTSTSMGIGAALAGVISGGTSKQVIPNIKNKAANDHKITGNSTTPLSSAAKITENSIKNKYDDAANRKNISTLSFQNKVLYYLGRIDKNLVNGIGKDSEGKTVEKVGISSSQNILGSLVTGLLGKGAGVVADGVGSAIGSGVGSLTGGLGAALLAGIKMPMVMPLAGMAVGGAILKNGIDKEAAIRTETDSFKKRQLIEEKNSNFWSRDFTGGFLPKLQDLKGSDGKPLISQKTIDTSLPTLGYKAWRRVSEDFDRGSNAILGGTGKNYLSTTTVNGQQN